MAAQDTVTLTRAQVEELRAIIHNAESPIGNRLQDVSSRLYFALDGAGWSPRAPTQRGWQCVPVEPTDAMKSAGGHINSEFLNDNAPIGESRYVTPMAGVYRAMLEAAPRAGCAVEGAAARDVLAERRRQISVEGWTPEHDDGHVNDEIAAMGCFYAMPPGAREWPATETGYGSTLGEAIVPSGWVAKQGDRRQELVKAGALILAEIERLDRGSAKS